MSQINENLMKITKYDLVGELPDLFLSDSGERISSAEQWEERRAEIYKTAIDLQYGGMPPKPEFLEIETLYLGGSWVPNSYRITTGRRECPVSFTMYMFKADTKEPAPTVISGDLCFKYTFDKEYVSAFLDNGINFVVFNRTELAPDIAGYNIAKIKHGEGEAKIAKSTLTELEGGTCAGQLKRAYPDSTFGSLAAWAWGYSRCVDALEILGNCDMNTIVFTGHSRGGKTAALAGADDERAAIVNPNASCSGGYGSYRIKIEAYDSEGELKQSEPLSNIFHHFPTWLGQGMRKYIDNEAQIPFDSHTLKAMVAPRVLFVSEAAGDIMANPVGSYQTTEAAAEVFKFLGCEENLIWYFREGAHAQTTEDLEQLVNVIKHVQGKAELNEKFFKLPFKKMPPAYSWKCPNKD